MTSLRRTTATAAALLALGLPLTLAAAGTASATPVHRTAVAADPAADLTLPRPTGPYEAGEDTLHLVDAARPDPWVPAAGPRQLMVTMYYPARHGTGRPAPYMTAAEARLFLAMEAPGGEGLAPALAGTRTYAFDGARPVPGRHPLIVLSPGFKLPRATLTGLAVDLAARGYVVALVDHTYENSGTTFPDGRTTTCALCDAATLTPEQIAASRAADVSFVLDELTGGHGRQPAWRHSGLIDRRRIGMAGHSLGGDAAVATMAADRRVRAGADLDGAFFFQVPAGGLGHRPFLMLGNPVDHALHGDEPSWAAGWPSLDGWKRWLTLTGANHASFTDVPLLADEAGIPGASAPIPSARALAITCVYVAAFFDAHLRGLPEPVLDGPSPAYPEVAYQVPPGA